MQSLPPRVSQKADTKTAGRATNEPKQSAISQSDKVTSQPQTAPQVDPELVIDIPGIWEIQNRGKNYTTYNFTSPIDQTTFTFSSFKEARKARESMRDVFVQQARFEAVVRQKTGKKPEDDV